MAWLGKQELHGNYAIAMRARCTPTCPTRPATKGPRRERLTKMQMANRDAQILLARQYTSGEHAGLYSYYTDDNWVPQNDWCDLSVSQISVLGVWACEQAGAEIPVSYWAAG